MLFEPKPWTNPRIRLYHGTIAEYAQEIVHEGVAVARGRGGTDFGPGFYTTTLERQAQLWANQLARYGAAPAVVQLDVEREDLAWLDTLAWVRGDFEADDFWSFVVHCRLGAPDHGRVGDSGGLYDVVIGPVASFWQQRALIAGADQISFHTAAAEQVLNSSARDWKWLL